MCHRSVTQLRRRTQSVCPFVNRKHVKYERRETNGFRVSERGDQFTTEKKGVQRADARCRDQSCGEKRCLASTITSKNAKRSTPRESNNTGVIVARRVICYLGMQFGGVRSTSQVANSFIGTGRVAGAVTFVRSAIFGPGGPRTRETPTFRSPRPVPRLADDYQ